MIIVRGCSEMRPPPLSDMLGGTLSLVIAMRGDQGIRESWLQRRDEIASNEKQSENRDAERQRAVNRLKNRELKP